MRVDFWNNPLVISAFRTKNRYGGLYTNLSIYLLFLGGVCIAAWYWIPEAFGRRGAEPRVRLHIIFAGLFVFQTILSAFWAMFTASAGMTSEITSGTLDYQRLTSLTPAQVLTGKLLGPPATAYLTIVGTAPLTFGLWSFDASGISLGTLLLLYVQQIATALLAGAVGLVKRLRAGPAQKSSQEVSGMGCLTAILALWLGIGVISNLPLLLRQQQTAVVGLVVPVGPLAGLFEHDDPWHYGLSLFRISVPFLLVTPLIQLVLAALCFVCMIRRLTSTPNPPLTKPLTYAVLAGIDILAAALLFEPGPASLGARTTTYWLFHSAAAFFLMLTVTPNRELLRTWIWRFRGRYSRFRDLAWQDRSENILVLVIFCLIGIAIYVLLVALPALLVGGWDTTQPLDRAVIDSLTLTCLVTLSVGTVFQASTFLIGRGGGVLVLIPVAIDFSLVFASEVNGIKWLRDYSVIAHWASWHAPVPPLSPLPALAVQLFVFLCAWTLFCRGLRRERLEIEQRQRQMGILQ